MSSLMGVTIFCVFVPFCICFANSVRCNFTIFVYFRFVKIQKNVNDDISTIGDPIYPPGAAFGTPQQLLKDDSDR